jgi:hypothetical protein
MFRQCGRVRACVYRADIAVHARTSRRIFSISSAFHRTHPYYPDRNANTRNKHYNNHVLCTVTSNEPRSINQRAVTFCLNYAYNSVAVHAAVDRI